MILQEVGFFLLLFSSVTFTYVLILTSHLCYFLFFFSIFLDQSMSFLLVSKNSFMTKNVNHLSCDAKWSPRHFIFIWLCQVLVTVHRIFHRHGGTQDPEFAKCTLSHGMQDLVPIQGSNPGLGIRSSALATGPPRKSRNIVFYSCQFTMVFCLSIVLKYNHVVFFNFKK